MAFDRIPFLLLLLVSGPPLAWAQQPPPPPAEGGDRGVELRVSTEVKAGFRWSEHDRMALDFPFPSEFVPVGEPDVALETVAPGSSLELSKATVFLDAALPRNIAAHAKIDFVDLYDRNPTSTDANVDVDEAWVSVGRRWDPLEPLPAKAFYVLLGKAPKLERQPVRRLESYGLVGTAFNRFPDLQLQAGAALGAHLYLVGQISNGNPIFMRDPNALAGDRGTDPPPRPDPKLHSGFPIFYHAEVEELELDDQFEYGGAAGLRFGRENRDRSIDMLAFFYRTTLSKKARLRGTFYEGDLDLLAGAGIPLPVRGNKRTEGGVNLNLRLGEFFAFGQFVREESAGLPRTGFEAELAWRLVLGDLGDPGDLFPAIQPALRYSRLDNDYSAPRGFVVPTAVWGWTRWDLGVRLTIVKRLDLTVEYSHNGIASPRPVHHDEMLGTLRFRF